MSWFLSAISSSVGRKIVMAATGLFLAVFLVIHLSGNFLLFAGAEKYDAYAHFLHSQTELLILSEVLLYAAFLAHVYLAVVLTAENWSARKKLYRMNQGKRDDRIGAGFIKPETWMFWSGLVVLGFVVIHVAEFKFEWGWGHELESLSPFGQAQVILASHTRQALYVLGCVILGIHVSHGVQSGFQSLGANHPKVAGLLKWGSVIFGVVVAVGFSSFPLTRMLGMWGNGDPVVEQPEAEEAPAMEEAAVRPRVLIPPRSEPGGGFGTVRNVLLSDHSG